ncbi:hypothetical protein MG293_018583 [Ovis ammon polii]|uniref:Uncharacterized protein n=1 Tax=Ovis ammon polii TaxID=230172 RepID=A0AAD4TTN3_OVIAM|nr:hypothetical protein MG293_018583 [Ovis ammon polii]KAI4551893.1 hypothetical protein MJT46_018145 [Ovis ammon polii x Ovis aries]
MQGKPARIWASGRRMSSPTRPLLAKVFRLSQYCVDLASPTSSSSLGTRDLVPPEEVPCSETIVTFDIDEMYAFSECDSKHVTFVTRQF